MKFLCSCGELIRDQSDYLSHKAGLVADEDIFDLHDVIDEIVADSADDPDAVGRRTGGFWRALYQCPACGRLFVSGEDGELHEFIPASSSTPRNLLAGCRTALFADGSWIDLADPASASTRLAWEEELRAELSAKHPLHGRSWRIMARRADRDDALLDLAPSGYAVVHLTWSGHGERPPWPRTVFYSTLREVVLHHAHDR